MSCDERKRMVIKQNAGVATVPASADHRNGDWISTDIYEGEFKLDTDTGLIYSRSSSGITTVSGNSLSIKRTLTSAEIKTGQSVPVQIIANNTAGIALEVISASWRFNWGTVQFDASFGTDMRLVIDTAGNGQVTMPSVIDSITNRFGKFNDVSGVSGLVAGKDLMWDCDDDSTVGDSTIDLYVNYRLITL